jgi:ketosteroid isomerase-like protein
VAVGSALIGGLAMTVPQVTRADDSPAETISSGGKPVFVQDVATDARAAVEVVDAFRAAIKAVDLGAAKDLLDETVLVLENGGSERSRDEYMGSHAIADAAFMQSARETLRYRRARVTGELAWVGTQSELERTKDGKPTVIFSSETMVLRKSNLGWRIVHIHWSSRVAEAGASS